MPPKRKKKVSDNDVETAQEEASDRKKADEEASKVHVFPEENDMKSARAWGSADGGRDWDAS